LIYQRVARLRGPSGAASGATPLVSRAYTDQNEQPYAVSDAFVASMVCLQVVSMVAFVDAFLARSAHVLRVWSICVLYIARCASGTFDAHSFSRRQTVGDSGHHRFER
jgi:hypothetical protein